MIHIVGTQLIYQWQFLAIQINTCYSQLNESANLNVFLQRIWWPKFYTKTSVRRLYLIQDNYSISKLASSWSNEDKLVSKLFIPAKVMVPYVQLSTNCGLDNFITVQILFSLYQKAYSSVGWQLTYGTIAFLCIKSSLSQWKSNSKNSAQICVGVAKYWNWSLD